MVPDVAEETLSALNMHSTPVLTEKFPVKMRENSRMMNAAQQEMICVGTCPLLFRDMSRKAVMRPVAALAPARVPSIFQMKNV